MERPAIPRKNMNTFILIFLAALVCISSAAEVFVRNYTTSTAKFEVYRSHRLFPPSVMSATTKETSSMDCAFSCLGFPWCFSYNFKKTSDDNNGMHICEVLSTDKYNSSQDFKPDQEFDHFSIENPCSESPCMNKGICVALYSHDDFKCRCPPQFKGKSCDVDVDECAENKHNCSADATCQNIHGSFNCMCNSAYTGNGVNCTAMERDCYDLLKTGSTSNGVYSVNPDGQGVFSVYCDMTTEGGGWTVFQRRQDGSQNFYLGWSQYKEGFGQLTGEFWLGNDKIHRLSAGRPKELRIEVGDWTGGSAYANYGSFTVVDETSQYRLDVGSYSGTAGDSLSYHNGMKFTTIDRDNDMSSGNCAADWTGAWWYKSCHYSNLNGQYLGNQLNSKGIAWWHYKSSSLSMKFAMMKLRPKL